MFSIFRNAAEAMVMNPPAPTKEKEKQGFFRAIKKKKKKTQMVRTLCRNWSIYLMTIGVNNYHDVRWGKKHKTDWKWNTSENDSFQTALALPDYEQNPPFQVSTVT